MNTLSTIHTSLSKVTIITFWKLDDIWIYQILCKNQFFKKACFIAFKNMLFLGQGGQGYEYLNMSLARWDCL